MKKLSFLTAAVAAFTLSSSVFAADTYDITDASPYYYQVTTNATSPPETVLPGVGGPQSVTDSGINHLPVFHGHFQTTQTYRFVNIAEQVLTMVGDGKHGLWRYQDSGLIREYITAGADGGAGGIAAPAEAVADPLYLSDPANMRVFVDGLSAADLAALDTDYAPFEELGPNPGDSFGSPGNGGYKSYTGGFNSVPVNADGEVTMIDLPIFHSKYGGKYDNHVPIDLPAWYCTMSYNGYASARAAMDFAFAQPGARDIGPLGQRAGIDITELYPDVVRIHLFGDGAAWINTRDSDRTAAATDEVAWHRINTDLTEAEYYLVMRPFFNEDYLFVIAVVNNDQRVGRGAFSYIRPDGAYWEHLVGRGEPMNNTFENYPRFDVLRANGTPAAKRFKTAGTRLYGVHHPGVGNRPSDGVAYNVQTGACPSMGGDFGEAYFGSAFANQYQEVTPLCDAFVIDIKFYANLDGVSWSDVNKNMANAAGSVTLQPGGVIKDYTHDTGGSPGGDSGLGGGTYGDFTDPYLINNNITNPDQFTTTGFDTLTFPAPIPQVACTEVNAGDCPNSQ